MRLLFLSVVLATSACFVAPNETTVGRFDDGGMAGGGTAGGASSGGSAGGNSSGGTAGGASAGGSAGGNSSGGTAGGASAGGSAGGNSSGGTAGGVSLQILLDAGVIPSAGTAPTICDTHGVLHRELLQRLPADAGCGNGCLFEVTQTATTLLYRSTSTEWLDRDIATGSNWEAFLVGSSSGQRRLMAVPFAGGALETIEQLNTANSSVTIWGRWFQDTLFYTLSITSQTSGTTTHTLKAWSHTAGPVQLATLPAYPKGPPAVASFAGSVFLALDTGVFVTSMYSPGVPTAVYASTTLGAATATDTGTAYWVEKQGTTWTLFTANLSGTPSPRAIGSGLVDVSAIAVGGADELGVLTASGVFLVTPSTRQARLIYAGGPFIQGFLSLRGLVAEGDRYAVGDLCYPDADAPEWGTVELTPPSPLGALPVTPGTARWVTGTAAWPWNTLIADQSSAGWSPRLPVNRSSRNGIVVSIVAP